LAAVTALQSLTGKFADRGGSSAHDDPSQTLERLAKLRDSGVITNADFAAKKAELLARM
jgi:Short C-terminal domain